jgi:alpha,alpha-trehalase
MLRNFISLSQRYGFIPNGGRNYFSMRSQPPVLAAMIKSYVDATLDIDFAKETVATLESEFLFWMENHTVLVRSCSNCC